MTQVTYNVLEEVVETGELVTVAAGISKAAAVQLQRELSKAAAMARVAIIKATGSAPALCFVYIVEEYFAQREHEPYIGMHRIIKIDRD